jgi:hypothetical protein
VAGNGSAASSPVFAANPDQTFLACAVLRLSGPVFSIYVDEPAACLFCRLILVPFGIDDGQGEQLGRPPNACGHFLPAHCESLERCRFSFLRFLPRWDVSRQGCGGIIAKVRRIIIAEKAKKWRRSAILASRC